MLNILTFSTLISLLFHACLARINVGFTISTTTLVAALFFWSGFFSVNFAEGMCLAIDFGWVGFGADTFFDVMFSRSF